MTTFPRAQERAKIRLCCKIGTHRAPLHASARAPERAKGCSPLHYTVHCCLTSECTRPEARERADFRHPTPARVHVARAERSTMVVWGAPLLATPPGELTCLTCGRWISRRETPRCGSDAGECVSRAMQGLDAACGAGPHDRTLSRATSRLGEHRGCMSQKCRAALRSVVAPLPAHLPALTNGGGGPHPSPPQPPQVAPHEETRQRNPGGQGELGRRSGGLVIMNVYHKSGMFLAPRLMNVLYTAGLVRHPPKGH